MGRLRAILILRGCLAALFVGLGLALLADGRTAVGVFAVAIGLTNATLVTVLARRARTRGRLRP